MKWNWGTKLVVAMAIFMAFIIFLVFRSIDNDVSLVEKDYYPKGLKYQDRLDEIANARPYADSIRIYQESEQVVMQLPEIQPDTGSVYFFRPSNNTMDRLYQLEPGPGHTMSFSKSEFQRGKYLIKLYWRADGRGFYVEKPFYFN